MRCSRVGTPFSKPCHPRTGGDPGWCGIPMPSRERRRERAEPATPRSTPAPGSRLRGDDEANQIRVSPQPGPDAARIAPTGAPSASRAAASLLRGEPAQRPMRVDRESSSAQPSRGASGDMIGIGAHASIAACDSMLCHPALDPMELYGSVTVIPFDQGENPASPIALRFGCDHIVKAQQPVDRRGVIAARGGRHYQSAIPAARVRRDSRARACSTP